MSDDAVTLIRARRAQIKVERRRLDDEDAELDQAEKTIVRLASQRQQATVSGAVPKTQKDFVIYTLKVSDNPWFESVRALRDAVALQGREIEMSTFQPLISSMTGEEIIVRDGPKVALAERVGVP